MTAPMQAARMTYSTDVEPLELTLLIFSRMRAHAILALIQENEDQHSQYDLAPKNFFIYFPSSR